MGNYTLGFLNMGSYIPETGLKAHEAIKPRVGLHRTLGIVYGTQEVLLCQT